MQYRHRADSNQLSENDSSGLFVDDNTKRAIRFDDQLLDLTNETNGLVGKALRWSDNDDPGAPSNQILLGIALFLTMALMRPTVSQMMEQGWLPYQEGRIGREEAWQRGTEPLRRHLLRFAREKDLSLMVEISHRPSPARPSDLGLDLLVPAYVLSELKSGFQIGAVLFLPFLIIDLVVASVTLSMGMVQLPPVMISAPFKILLFVLANGWHLVVGGLLKSFSS